MGNFYICNNAILEKVNKKYNILSKLSNFVRYFLCSIVGIAGNFLKTYLFHF